MSVLEQNSRSFGMFPLLLLAAMFSLLAPLFWTHVEAPAGPAAVNYENPEVYGRVLPSTTYAFSRLRAGEWPLWSPQQYGGIPFFSNPVHGMLQPLNLIFLAVPPITGLALHAFAGLFLMALFGALLLRLLGAAWLPAAIGGLVYAFCGATVAIMSLPEMLGVLIWPPLLHGVLHLHTSSPRRILVVAGGFLVAFLLLSGQPALGALQCAGALAYGALRAIALHRRGLGSLGAALRGLGGMLLLGVLLSAVQWVPWLAWLGTLDQPAEGIWPRGIPGHLPAGLGEVPAGLLVPRSGSVPGLLYFGAIPLVLLPPALLHRPRRFEVLFFLGAAVVWIGLAVWGATPGAPAEAWKLCVYPGALGVAIVAGIGADRLLLTGRDPRSPLIWGSVAAALAAALVLLLIGTAETRGRIAMAVLVLLPFFVFRLRWVGVLCGTALAFLIFVDFREASRNVYQHPFTGPANWLGGCQAALQEAEAHTLGDRILSLPASRESVLPANLGLVQRVRAAGGAHWPLTPDQRAWWDALAPFLNGSARAPEVESAESGAPSFPPQLLNHMAARVIAGEGNPGWIDGELAKTRMRIRYLSTQGRINLWKNDSALPRARWVPAWEATTTMAQTIEILTGPDFSGRSACLVASDSEGIAELAAALPPGTEGADEGAVAEARCTLTHDGAELVEISAETPAPGILVLADSYAPGWRAFVNGRRAPVLRVNGLSRGVYLPAGTHSIQFSYAPLSVTVGLLITGAALAGLAGWGLFLASRGAMAWMPRLRRA